MNLFYCLVGHDDLGNIDRKGKSLSHWAMESSGICNKFVKGLGISKGKYNLASGSTNSFRWNEMEIKGLEWKVELREINNH